MFRFVSSAQDFDYLPIGPGELIHHSFFSLSYSEEHEQAYWVAYEFTYQEAFSAFERSDDFRFDPSVSTGSADLEDYIGSGYDRGHLAPAGDMGFSETAMTESFYFSNMSPQDPSFNRGIWKKLESQVRSWALTDSLLYVVTGPVLEDSLPTIGPNQVAVPRAYFKIVLSPEGESFKGIGFLLPNAKNSQAIEAFIVSIDSIETLTGLDFFPALEDSVEFAVEQGSDAGAWQFGLVNAAKAGAKSTAEAKQCMGVTQKKKRCKKSAGPGSDYCHLHEYQAPTQCKAITNSGTRCSRLTVDESGKCWQHK